MVHLKFGVVGAGHIGKRHMEMIRRNPAFQLTAFADIRSRSECGVDETVPHYDSIERMLDAHEELDVVCICTPNGFHAEQSILAIKSDCHVVIEKPMALNRQDGEDILHTALSRGKQVFCVMQNRYSPPSIWLKDLISSDALGKIHMVQVQCYWNRDDRYYGKIPWKGKLDLDGGTLFTQFSHFIDLMYWVFGDIHRIQSRFVDFNHNNTTEFEDSGLVSFEFVKHNALGTFNFSTSVAHKNFESSVTIIAEKGTIKVGGQYMNEVEYCDVLDYTMPELPPSNPANDYGHYKGSAANHGYIFENIEATLIGDGQITTNALEGLKVVDIIERMYAAGERPLKKR
ncbi:Gfo/Idh/MocA family oxidoreductase [Flavobacteriales bacterium]|jgi:UDP-N-acetyl-2-amino-2-deoxyglucuronate dehydrogenase|nr:Gfo/Idh/MocA family oxidoreductase [Flavobacteriales bacterium]MDA8771935.1 Gfo/Idh/MocA family oxidoreductase [Flavobacteriales bacterium]MDA9019229.1 Gfo/Idh/MocA family oxidoreductase [Flavobacteriales bacterium]